MMHALDLIFFTLNSILLVTEGYSDYKYRGIPLYIVLLHLVLAITAVTTRVLIQGWWFVVITHWIIPIVIIPVVLIYINTGLVGEGDILVLISSGLASPYIPLGYLSGLQVPVPFAIVASSVIPLYRYYKTTSVVYVRGIGKVRARVRYAVDLKRGLIGSEHPIYIDGYGVVSTRLFKDPSSISKLIESVPDYVLVYTVPHYPYIYYYSVSFIATYLLVTIVSLIAGLVIAGVA